MTLSPFIAGTALTVPSTSACVAATLDPVPASEWRTLESVIPTGEPSRIVTARPKAEKPSSEVHAVLALAGRTFVLLGERARSSSSETQKAERVVVAG